jgi:Big-like domain-containing protein
MVLAAGVVTATLASGGHAAPARAAPAAAQQARSAAPLRVLSVTPAAGAKDVNGAAPVRVRFSAPLAASTPMPTLSPYIAGRWQVEGDIAVFTPASGYFQDTHVTLNMPGGPDAMIAVNAASTGNAGRLAASVTEAFTTGSFSTLRLQQLLSQLGYLPLTWTPNATADISASNANAELSAAYQPPAGTFSWTGNYPSNLKDQWQAGSGSVLQVGAVRAFESVTRLTMDGVAGHTVWFDLLSAVAQGPAIVGEIPDGLDDLRAGQHPARMPEEELQQAVLLR